MAELIKREELREAIREELEALIAETQRPWNWIDVPWSAELFGSDGGVKWSVPAGSLVSYRYLTLSPTVMVVTFRINNTTATGAISVLRLRLPVGAKLATFCGTVGFGTDSGTNDTTAIYGFPGNEYLSIQRLNAGSWSFGGAVYVTGQIWLNVVAPPQ